MITTDFQIDQPVLSDKNYYIYWQQHATVDELFSLCAKNGTKVVADSGPKFNEMAL